MAQVIKVERRVPFGFVGDWATLYKLYTFDDVETVGQTSVVKYQNHNYLKIHTKLQLKTRTNASKMRSIEPQVSNLESRADHAIVETTDAYFDVSKKVYKCVADAGDLINYRGEWWEIEKIDIEVKYTPGRQEHYYMTIKKVEGDVVVW